jgi:hypothetical protein
VVNTVALRGGTGDRVTAHRERHPRERPAAPKVAGAVTLCPRCAKPTRSYGHVCEEHWLAATALWGTIPPPRHVRRRS